MEGFAWEAGHVPQPQRSPTEPVSENNTATEWRSVGIIGKVRLLKYTSLDTLQ